MTDFQRIFILTSITAFLTIGLFVFAVISGRQDEAQQMIACGTVVTSRSHSLSLTPLEHAGLEVFQNNCKACHRLDTKLVGPALRGSFARNDSIRFVKMIVSTNDLIKTGDEYAVQVFNEYDRLQHPDFKGLSEKQLTDLTEYLKLEGERAMYVE